MNSEDARALTDEPEGLGLSDYMGILRRRIWYLILPAIVIFVIAASVALLMPATYRSTATILIEQQQIPQDLVRSTVTSFADQRLQVISQRVMTTANLSKVIEKYKLFAAERKNKSMTELVRGMRQNIALEMVDAKVVDPRSGSAKNATIAFTLSFDSESARKAQQVASELVSLFLDENLRKRQEAARETSDFLGGEADRLGEQIADLEAKVARFKEEHGDNLPEMQQVNARFLQRTEDQIDDTELQEALLEQRLASLESELARTDRYALGLTDSGNRVPTKRGRLAELELERQGLAARFKENHPDLIYLQREIDLLRQQTGGLTAAELQTMLKKAQADLATLRADFSEEHPEVKAAVESVASLEQQLADASAKKSTASSSQPDENPVYLQLKSDLTAVNSELVFLRQKRDGLAADVKVYEERLKEAPKIEREYRALTRDYDNAISKYREIKGKEMEADLAQSLETERKAERFVLIEPPVVPGKPIKPNRLAIVFMGAVLSLGGGLGATVLREMLSPGMYGTKPIVAITGAPPLAVIPYIETEEESAKKRRRKRAAMIAAVLLFAIAVAGVHWFYRPLDMIALQILQRLDLVNFGGGS